MKTLCVLPSNYDVLNHSPKSNYPQINHNQMSVNKKIYRDKNGALIAENPCDWQDAVCRIREGRLEFGRKPATAQEYRTKMEELRKEWRSIDDYCLHTFLGYPVESMQSNGKVVKFANSNVPLSGTNCMEIALNDFPYHLTCDLEHYVLWSTCPLPRKAYDEFVEARFPSNHYDWQMFENVKKNKSVKTVAHLQLLVRRKDS